MSKRSRIPNGTGTRMNSQKLWQAQARWDPSSERGNGHGPPSLTKKLSPIEICSQGKNWFSTVESHWGDKPYFKTRNTSSRRCQHKSELRGILKIFIFKSHVTLFGEFLSYWSFAGMLQFQNLCFYEFCFCVCLCACLFMCVRICVFLCACLSVDASECMSVCVSVYVHMSVCMCACLYVCVCVYMSLCVFFSCFLFLNFPLVFPGFFVYCLFSCCCCTVFACLFGWFCLFVF